MAHGSTACDAYVLSQTTEGWRTLQALYDDGGHSGGGIKRPALRRLLEDVAAKRIDVVLVYKGDRLTRSLADFARIIEAFEAVGDRADVPVPSGCFCPAGTFS